MTVAFRLIAVGLLFVITTPGASAQRLGDETHFFFDLGPAVRYTAAAEADVDFEASLTTGLVSFDDDRYRAYGIAVTYAGNDYLDILSGMARLEWGLGAPSANRSGKARIWANYLAVEAGYSTGTVWDNAYFDVYDDEELVEIDVTGLPAYVAWGFRRVGGLTLRIEGVAGAIFVMSKDSEDERGDAPSVIPSVGFRVAVGTDSFWAEWMNLGG
jgi:hypothetical protein